MISCITGATGFIGSHLADRLLARGDEVRVLVRSTSNLRWLNDKPVTLIHGDIRDAASLGAFLQDADEIYHVAGVVKSRDRKGYFEGNVDATRNMLDAAARVAPNLRRFLFVSSQTAAGPAEALDRPVTEDMPCRPITTYGESKVAAEKIVREHPAGLPWTIVRPPAVYGPRDTEIFIYFQAVARGLNSIIGFNDKRLSLIHSSDLVDGILLAASAPNAVRQTYFISSEQFYAWPDVGRITARALGTRYVTLRLPHTIVYAVAAIAQTMAAIAGKAATLNIEKARDITTQYWICDVGKAMRELGYRQRVSIEQGFTETAAWYRQQGWLK